MSSPSGNLFRREWFAVVEDWPREVTGVVRAWDDAATHDGGDWSVGVLMAMARNGIAYVIDVVRIQGSPLEVERLKTATAHADAQLTNRRAVILLQQEPGASGKSYVDSQMRGPLSGFAVEVERPSGDKYTRALPMSSAAQAGNIKLVRGNWNKAFIDELEQAGPDQKLYDHDDQWDAGSSAFNYLASHRQECGLILVRTLTGRYDPRFADDDGDSLELRKERQLGKLIKSRRFGPGAW